MAILTLHQLGYVCREMLGVDDWMPDLSQPPIAVQKPDGTWEYREDREGLNRILTVLNLCQSKLEIMFLLGVAHFMERAEGYRVSLWATKIEHEGKEFPGVWFLEPWNGMRCGGPSSMTFVPQLEIGGLHRDFGVFYSGDNGNPQGRLAYLIEVDGYVVHRDRRAKDSLRDRNAFDVTEKVEVPILRLYEESDNPLDWFEQIVEGKCREIDANTTIS